MIREGAPRCVVDLRAGADSAAWRLEIEEEDGRVHLLEGRRRSGTGALRVRLPSPLPAGYHRLRAWVSSGGEEREGGQALIVTPARCVTVGSGIGPRGAFGLIANLYTLRSERNWGAGNLTDLRALIRWAAGIGASFVGVNPLHALRNRGWDISPYGPVSRLYRNSLYLDVTAVPEFRASAQAGGPAMPDALREEIDLARKADRVDYERVTRMQGEVLARCFEIFRERHLGRKTARGRAFEAFARGEGAPLEDFATWAALEGRFRGPHPDGRGWLAWPEGYRDPRSPAVTGFREEHRADVDFHRYVQFEIDGQLGAAAETARRAGMPLGVYTDLAIGSAPDGADTWAFPGLFLGGATLGAPPDDYARDGQNWGLPPLDPIRLRASGYFYFARMLRAGMRHAGALRIDHVMGLARQFWIPAGCSPAEGAYLRFPSEELLGIIALESARAGAIVIGEDLGTVPRGLPATLARRGILSSRVFYFQRTREGRFLPPQEYPARALVTANTHDHAPLEGYFDGRDLVLRRSVGAIATDEDLDRALAARAIEREGALRRLRAEALLPADAPARGPAFRAAVHAFLHRTPARLVGVSLDDLTGEEDPVNLPGVTLDRYPSWSRRMRLPLEALRRDPGVAQSLAGLRGRGRKRKK
jgi:4-alpha-glucanotransferase